eukprot:gene9546-1715_t
MSSVSHPAPVEPAAAAPAHRPVVKDSIVLNLIRGNESYTPSSRATLVHASLLSSDSPTQEVVRPHDGPISVVYASPGGKFLVSAERALAADVCVQTWARAVVFR